MNQEKQDELYILWTNGDPITAREMVLLYAMNAMKRGWWKKVTVIIWGAPARLIAEDPGIQEEIKTSRLTGVQYSACKKCSDDLGVTEILTSLGIEARYWGEPLTGLLKSGARLLTV